MKKYIVFILVIIQLGCDVPSGELHSKKTAGIAISFDDRYVAQWDSLLPILKKYDAKVTFYVTQFDSLTDSEKQILVKLQNEGHEIGAHGSTHSPAVSYAMAHSTDAYIKNEVESEVNAMKKWGLKISTYAHPGGQQAWFINQRLSKYFTLWRDVALKNRKIGFFTIRRQVSEIDEVYYHSKEQNVYALLIDDDAEVNEKDIEDGFFRAKKDHAVMLLFAHKPTFAHKSGKLGMNVFFLEKILKEAKKQGLKSYTMSELAHF